jgi:large subunit ribosomal protein L7/L12
MSDGAKEFSAKVKELGDQLVGLTLLEAKQLVDYMKEVHGIEPAAGGGGMMMAMPAGGGAAAGAAAEAEEAPEKTSFDVVISKITDTTKKIGIIKVVRELTGLGLKEAKALVDAVPSDVKKGAPKDDAEDMKKKLEEAGAVVELK